MFYPKSKIYSDGSHFIAIPETKQSWKKRKQRPDTDQQKAKKIYDSCEEQDKQAKIEKVTEEINEEIGNLEKSKALVQKVVENEKRNQIVRLTRLYRKVNLQNWTHFCTFTYDSEKMNEEEFKKKLLNCLRHLANRKGWKYIGVWERSPTDRLHFHGIFVIKEMVGKIIETTDYSTKNHKMQTTFQNTFFLERFGRNDFKEIVGTEMTQQAVSYMLKYIRKTNDKVIYSKHLQTYFYSDILETDVVCKIGQEERKLLLFDDFRCIDSETGEVLGTASKETANKKPKGY